MDTPTPPPQNPDTIYRVSPMPPAPKKKWFSFHMVLGVVFVVSLLAAIVSGIFYWKTFIEIPSTGNHIPPHREKVESTADWKTYTNTQYGFEFKYPNTWQTPEGMPSNDPRYKNFVVAVQELDSQAIEPGSIVEPTFEIKAYDKITDIPTISDQFQALDSEIQSSRKSITIDGQTQIENYFKSFVVEGSYQITHQVTVNKNNKIFVLSFLYVLAGCSVQIAPHAVCDAANASLTDRGEKIWGQIISTFKFTQ